MPVLPGSVEEPYYPRHVTLKEYAAGALLANAPILILSAALPPTLLEESLIASALVVYITTMAGGIWGGYLIARRTMQDYLRAGLPTGLFAYSFYAIFMSLIGFKVDFVGDLPALLGFFIGGAVGARLWEKSSQEEEARRLGHCS